MQAARHHRSGAGPEPDPELLAAFDRLEEHSRWLREVVADPDTPTGEAALRARARSTLDGHLLAARLAMAAGASRATVRTLLCRAEGGLTPR